MRLTAATLLLLPALLLTSTASAQLPGTTPVATLHLDGLPADLVATNETVFVAPVTLHLTLAGLNCLQGATFQVALSGGGQAATPAPDNQSQAAGDEATQPVLTVSVLPSTISFDVPPGAYLAAPFQASRDLAVVVDPASVPVGGLNVTAWLAAELPTGSSGCLALGGDLAGTTAEGNFSVAFTSHFWVDEAPVEQAMPAPLWLALAALAAVAVGFRRSRA